MCPLKSLYSWYCILTNGIRVAALAAHATTVSEHYSVLLLFTTAASKGVKGATDWQQLSPRL